MHQDILFTQKKLKKQKFEPRIIFDFIRHGEAEYGKEFETQVKETTGYKLKEILPGLKVVQKELGKKVGLEGRLTSSGQVALRKSIATLIQRIDRRREILFLLWSPRTRTADSAIIIREELRRAGIKIEKSKEERLLIDFNPHQISIIQFMYKKTSGKEKDIVKFWAKMWKPSVAKEMKNLGFEGGLIEVDQRMNKFIEMIKKYSRRHKKSFALNGKKLRVIAITSDIPMEQILQMDTPFQKRKSLYIRNAQIAELGIDAKGKKMIMAC